MRQLARMARLSGNSPNRTSDGVDSNFLRGIQRMFSIRAFTRQATALALAALGIALALPLPAAAAAPETDTYSMTGYEVYYAPDQAVFVGTGAGLDGPRELSGWYTSVYHTLSVSPGNVTGGWATLQRIDGVRIDGAFSRGDVAQTNPGYDCTTETHVVTANLANVTRTDQPGLVGTGLLTATLTHYHAWIFGTCYAYSARVDATITVTV
jgi:hypothetical protein